MTSVSESSINLS